MHVKFAEDFWQISRNLPATQLDYKTVNVLSEYSFFSFMKWKQTTYRTNYENLAMYQKSRKLLGEIPKVKTVKDQCPKCCQWFNNGYKIKFFHLYSRVDGIIPLSNIKSKSLCFLIRFPKANKKSLYCQDCLNTNWNFVKH